MKMKSHLFIILCIALLVACSKETVDITEEPDFTGEIKDISLRDSTIVVQGFEKDAKHDLVVVIKLNLTDNSQFLSKDMKLLDLGELKNGMYVHVWASDLDLEKQGFEISRLVVKN
jgi:hypothetical protein